MSDAINKKRRHFLQIAGLGAASLAASQLLQLSPAQAQSATQPSNAGLTGSAAELAPIKQIRAGVLDIGYYEAGPKTGPVVLLLHGYPYSIQSFAEVAPILAGRGYRVIVPHLRGHGSTRFIDPATPRSGQQGAIGADVIALMDALEIKTAVFAGFDWGGRAACVAAALWPERCNGLVSVNSYLVQDIAHATAPIPAKLESGLWYQYYFQTERGRLGLTADRRAIAKVIWTRNSPGWNFDDATLERTAKSFDNPDYVDVVIHSYRHRLGLAAGYPAYADIEKRLAALPPITLPAITLDGVTDGNYPAGDGSATAARFLGKRVHRQVPNAGHNLPQEAPQAFADAVTDVLAL
ncbi:alpha/beta fold hydrolase [Pseudomonas fluorescens]|uniref:2-succinyl-6-hydroxy-2, 4-cyclohexadiene-1-carboxylate synthase n=1 Tax=Pseudomonas fluorescens TaxID=294 RepID=A0A5E7EY83_PSEFL|nr:alpha/beta hydrolase [Pseudomonas fluorescens]VVO31809.1 2-succinyl-6-hydroxy-2, 4-cyclohexadiene-1-carboxylate synthase [Pseudomonas fluorescens]